MFDYLLPLLQLCDSNFPTGAFSHSFGLETYIQQQIVYNKESFYQYIKTLIFQQIVYTDGLSCRLAYEAVDNNNLTKIWELDKKLKATALAYENREGSRRIGERLLTLGMQLYPSLPIITYLDLVKTKKGYCHPALAFSLIAHNLKVPKATTVICYMYTYVTNLIQNAVRGIPLGQSEGQQLIKECQTLIIKAWEEIEKLTENDLGITPPGLEISQMQHERLDVRIFMS